MEREENKRAHHGGMEEPPGKSAAGRYAASAGGLRNPLLTLLFL
jgi:hypothetical protein